MSYIDLIKAFERWLETNYLPISSQLLWYKLISLFNRCGWSEWVIVDNQRLMALLDMKREATFISCRDKLIKAGLFEYRKGKKGNPNQYKICTANFEMKDNGKKPKNNTENYEALYKKYEEQIKKIKYWGEKIHILNKLQKDEKYLSLNEDEQKRIFEQLVSL